MTTKNVSLLAALVGPVLLLSGPAVAADGKEDLPAVYEAGRAAFNRGDLAKAKVAFQRVLKAKPDFDLARIYMAQIRVAEEKWAARPRSQKIAETAVVASTDMSETTLANALEVVRREVERAGSGPTAGPIQLVMDLPPARLEQPVSLSARGLPMKSFIEAVAYAGGVGITWHEKGLSVTSTPVPPSGTDKATLAAIQKMKQTAAAKIIPRLHFEDVALDDALVWLRRQTDPANGPLIVEREPLPNASITLELRNISVAEALRLVAMQANVDLDWQPWGVGIRVKDAEPAIPADKPPA